VGTIDAIGEDVQGLRPGERVAAFTLFGGYARYLCVPAQSVAGGIPPGLDAAQAVALVLNYTTAYQMLHRVASVSRGQSVLVYGGSGGVGSALLDLANHFGATVAAAVSKRWQDSFKSQAGLLFDERDPACNGAIREFRNDGFDAAFDPIGGSHVWRTRTLVKRNGKLVVFGIASAVKGNGRRDRSEVLRLGLLLAASKVWRRPSVELYAIDQRVKTKRAEINEDIRTLMDLLHSGAIHPRIGATFPLAEASKAHELIESRNNVGKIVLIP
jgi:NADPH:quinone reductase-like Zn-dependent oxidoreductase